MPPNLGTQLGDSDLTQRPWTAKCVCGKQFMQPNSYALHVGCCAHFKRRLSQRLSDAKQRNREVSSLPNPHSSQGVDGPINNPNERPIRPGPWAKKRRPAWLDDENLDVDNISPPSPIDAQAVASSSVPAPTTAVILANAQTNGQSESLPDHHLAQLGKGHRTKKLSYKVKPKTNFLPSSTLPISLFPSDALLQLPPPKRRLPVAPVNEEPDEEMETESSQSGPLPTVRIRTPSNKFGLYKIFNLGGSRDIPHDPDDSILPEDLHEREGLSFEESAKKVFDNSLQASRSEFYPFPNISAYRLGQWYWSDDREKSQRSFQDLLSIVGSEDFNPADVKGANWKKIDRDLAGSAYDIDDLDSKEWVDDGISWNSVSVTLQIPFSQYTENPGNHLFTIEGFHYRPLTPIIKAKLESSSGREYFQYHGSMKLALGTPGKWEGGASGRLVGEIYTSPAFLEAYEALQASPPEPKCTLLRHVVGLMFASDSTMLATFGTAKLWPLYMFFGNDSKYRRAKPTEQLFETVAYFEKLPDSFKDFFVGQSGKATIPPALLTHCQRELFHEQWRHLLDDEFIHAYCHGIVVTCYDGLERRFYPRILTYSADYPEKILLASIKNLGSYPCPRCNVTMKDVPAMGKRRDCTNRTRTARTDDEERQARVSKARSLIYDDHHPVTSSFLVGHLAYGSLIATNNAFSEKLSNHGFDLYKMLVVDVMHEVELGVWKAIFIQLLRLMEASNKGSLNTLDERYRGVPTFGRDTIRRFTNNVSEMKQLAARDWEDLLQARSLSKSVAFTGHANLDVLSRQCAIPAFEGLLPPPHNNRVLKLLFIFAQWHGLAKLRMHTDHTLHILDTLTTDLGNTVRDFAEKTCASFQTKELKREYQARKRRESKKEAQVKGKATSGKKKATGPAKGKQPARAAGAGKGKQPAKTAGSSKAKAHVRAPQP
ncbi:hypothetical protein NMY22_g10179 [Coprinellus aureogranulatus]|nr:hypothetical protein NMY22_g10179 [Coprinellus aureogranulatus]